MLPVFAGISGATSTTLNMVRPLILDMPSEVGDRWQNGLLCDILTILEAKRPLV